MLEFCWPSNSSHNEYELNYDKITQSKSHKVFPEQVSCESFWGKLIRNYYVLFITQLPEQVTEKINFFKWFCWMYTSFSDFMHD